MRVSFYDNRGVVHALITDKNDRVRLSMGVRVSPFKFKGRFVGKGAKIEYLNHELDKRKALLGEICLKHGIENVRHVYTPEPTKWEAGTDVVNLCSSYVDGMRDGSIRTKGAKQFSIESIRTYAASMDYLAKFMQHQESKDGCRYDIRQFHVDRKEKAVQAWTTMFRRFEEWMTDRQMNVRSRQNVINQIGIMVRHWGEQMFIPLPKTPSVMKPEKEVIALPPAFVKEFFDSPRPESPELRMVWEVAAVILTTTLRIGDVMSLRPVDFSDDFRSIRKVLRKTGTCSMPLPSVLTDILVENMAKNGWIFSVLPNKTIVYKHLRPMMAQYQSLRQIVALTSQDIHGNKIVERMPYWMLVTPHTLRKTAITSMIWAGVSHMHVRHASGHSQSSRTFWQYVKIVEDNYADDISQAQRKLGISK